MKKFFYYAMMAFVMVGMVACEEETGTGNGNGTNGGTNGGNGGNGGGTGNNALAGTAWVISEDYTDYDTTATGVDIYQGTVTETVIFNTATAGKVTMHSVETTNGQPSEGSPWDYEEAFTYVYSGTATSGRGTITMTDVDDETGETETFDTPFTINGNELTVIDTDDETGQTRQIVFTRSR